MKSPKEYIIFPLDLPSYDQAISYVDMLKDHVGLFKVGLELFGCWNRGRTQKNKKLLKARNSEAGEGLILLTAFVF
ncbi:MAG: hypothetical protein ABIB93_05365 [Chloroflexota bacterium]